MFICQKISLVLKSDFPKTNHHYNMQVHCSSLFVVLLRTWLIMAIKDPLHTIHSKTKLNIHKNTTLCTAGQWSLITTSCKLSVLHFYWYIIVFILFPQIRFHSHQMNYCTHLRRLNLHIIIRLHQSQKYGFFKRNPVFFKLVQNV